MPPSKSPPLVKYEGRRCLRTGRRHGYGVLSVTLTDGTVRKIYVGDWVCGRKDGTGSFWYTNGSYYEGQFRANRRHGFGRMSYADGRFYQGTWERGVPHGRGLMVYATGDRYEGDFANGKKEGPGGFYHLNTGQLQEGLWLADLCVGSTIEDIYWRQSSRRPTPFPIPELRVGKIMEGEIGDWK